MEWGAAIAAIFSVLLPLLQWWIANAPERKIEAQNEAKQQGRQDIVEGNARVDGLLSISGEQSGDSGPSPSTEEAQRRLDAL
jgi:hypothetical protein